MLTTRFYENETDLQQMEDLLIEARSLTNDWRYWHIGELAFNFFMVACHLNPQEKVRLWMDDGILVGFVILGEDPSIDFQFLPDYEWIGIEDEALNWAETRIHELSMNRAEPWDGVLVSGTRQDDQKRLAFLENHGFRYRGDFTEVNMLRSLDEPISESTLPTGYHVREVANR